MAGGVNPAERCQTWRFTTNSFAVTPAMMPTTTSLHFVLRVTPLRISADVGNRRKLVYESRSLSFGAPLELWVHCRPRQSQIPPLFHMAQIRTTSPAPVILAGREVDTAGTVMVNSTDLR